MSGEMQKSTYLPRELSVIGAVGDAHRQLKDALGMSPFATFPDDATLVIRIRKGKSEMDVHVDIERPPSPEVRKVDMPISTADDRVHIYEEEIIIPPQEEVVYYDTVHHYPMIRPWLPKDDPDHSFVVTKLLQHDEVVWTITHRWNDADWLPSRFKLDTDMGAPKIYWSGAEVIKRSEEIEDAFGHQGTTDVSY